MQIPYTALSDDALRNLIIEFVSGTDDNGYDVDLEANIQRIRDQLESGEAVIYFDTESETCSVRIAAT